jgi:hypothetical protein
MEGVHGGGPYFVLSQVQGYLSVKILKFRPSEMEIPAIFGVVL